MRTTNSIAVIGVILSFDSFLFLFHSKCSYSRLTAFYYLFISSHNKHGDHTKIQPNCRRISMAIKLWSLPNANITCFWIGYCVSSSCFSWTVHWNTKKNPLPFMLYAVIMWDIHSFHCILTRLLEILCLFRNHFNDNYRTNNNRMINWIWRNLLLIWIKQLNFFNRINKSANRKSQ